MNWNKILTDEDRKELNPIILNMRRKLPEMMGRKIPEADVQQAFVVRSVLELVPNGLAKILCVGAYEDTAYEFLKLDKYVNILGIDPYWGNDPFELYQWHARHDCVFATSVLEHTADPKKFVTKMMEAIKPSGIGILTCDYCEDWPEGAKISPEHTMFNHKWMVSLMDIVMANGGELVGEELPAWGKNPKHFHYNGKWHYDFATMVFKKKEKI